MTDTRCPETLKVATVGKSGLIGFSMMPANSGVNYRSPLTNCPIDTASAPGASSISTVPERTNASVDVGVIFPMSVVPLQVTVSTEVSHEGLLLFWTFSHSF